MILFGRLWIAVVRWFRPAVIAVLAMIAAVVEFELIVPEDGESGGLAYIAALLVSIVALTYLARGQIWPAVLGAFPTSAFLFISNLSGDNDGLQLLIVPWVLFMAFLQLFAAALGRSAWQARAQRSNEG